MKPRDGSLGDPACLTQTAAVRLATSRDFGGNAGCMQRAAIFVVVVASVALNDTGLRKRPAALASDGWNSLDQRLELSHIVAVGASQYHRKWDALRFGDEVML